MDRHYEIRRYAATAKTSQSKITWNDIPPVNGNISANSGDLPHITRVKSDYVASEGEAILLTEEQYNELIASPTGTIEVEGETFFREYELNFEGPFILKQTNINFGEIELPEGFTIPEGLTIPEQQTYWTFIAVDTPPEEMAQLGATCQLFIGEYESTYYWYMMSSMNGESGIDILSGDPGMKSFAVPNVGAGIISKESSVKEELEGLKNNTWNNILPVNGNTSANSGDLPHITKVKSDYVASEGAAILLTEAQYQELLASPTGTIEVDGETFFREYKMEAGDTIFKQTDINFGDIELPEGFTIPEGLTIPEQQTYWMLGAVGLPEETVQLFIGEYESTYYWYMLTPTNETIEIVRLLEDTSIKSLAAPPVVTGIIPGSSTTEEKINNLDSEVENLKAEIEALKAQITP